MATLVFCEDDLLIRKLISACLRQDDHTIHFANNGQEGLALIAREAPTMVFTDLWMPLVTGAEMWEQLRADERFATLPVIFLTGALDDSRLNELLTEPNTALLPKPFTPHTLRAMIERHSSIAVS